MRWATLRNALNGLLGWSTADLEICFTGGEPLLAFPLLCRAVSYVERMAPGRRVRYKVLTNGTLLTDARIAFFDRHGFEVRLSFDGVQPAHDQRGRGTFRRLDGLLDRLRRTAWPFFDRRLTVAVTLTASAVRYLADTVEYFLDKGVRSLGMAPVMGPTGWKLDQIEELDGQFDRLTRRLRRHCEYTGEVPLTLFRKTEPDPVRTAPDAICLAGQGQNLAIDADGQAYGCLLASGSYQRRPAPIFRPALAALRAGSLAGPDLETRLARMSDAARRCGAFRQPERRYSSYGRCADCDLLGRCLVCPLAAAPEEDWDDVYRVPDFHCAFRQVSIRHRDGFPSQPGIGDILTGRAEIPGVMKDLMRVVDAGDRAPRS